MIQILRGFTSRQFRYANAVVWGGMLKKALDRQQYTPAVILDLCGGDGLFLKVNYAKDDLVRKVTVDIKARPSSIGHCYIQHDIYSGVVPDFKLKPDVVCFLNTFNLLKNSEGLAIILTEIEPRYLFVAVPTTETLELVRRSNPGLNLNHASIRDFVAECGYEEVESGKSMRYHYLLQPLRLFFASVLLRFERFRENQLLDSGYYETILFRRCK